MGDTSPAPSLDAEVELRNTLVARHVPGSLLEPSSCPKRLAHVPGLYTPEYRGRGDQRRRLGARTFLFILSLRQLLQRRHPFLKPIRIRRLVPEPRHVQQGDVHQPPDSDWFEKGVAALE